MGQGELFDKLAASDVLYHYPPESLEKLNALVRVKGTTLDVGCGDGIIGQAYDAKTVIGVDISHRCALLAKRRGVDAVVGDAIQFLPFGDASFDTVYCVDVLHHLDQLWEPIFTQLDRVLKPGGTLCIVEPDARNPFVRWTQAPHSPIRVAPWHNEPAINPAELTPQLARRNYKFTLKPIHIEGSQTERSTFPMWQRLLKAPFVIMAAWIYRNRPNKFAIVASKPK